MAKKIRNALRSLNAQFIADVAAPPAYTQSEVDTANDDTQVAPESTSDTEVQSDTQEQPTDTQDTESTEKREPRILEDLSATTASPVQEDAVKGTSEQEQQVAATAPKLTKKLQVRNFIAATPASVKTIATHLGISNIAAQSLIGDLKRDKVQIVSKKVDKVTLYTVAA